MSENIREFATGSNSDRRLLGRDFATMLPYVLHQANEPSGNAATRIDVGVFLRSGPAAPEHHALLRLIETPVATDEPTSGRIMHPSPSLNLAAIGSLDVFRA